MDHIKYGIIHAHTENSMKDSTMSPTQLVQRASELGAPAVTITDHGTMSGIFEAVRAGESCGVKIIPGVEAYVQEDEDLKRQHLLLLAKNKEGFHAICRAVTASNNRIDKVPRMNKEILKKYFGPGSTGYGNVIATSACVAGVLASILLQNKILEKEIEKIDKACASMSSPHDKTYLHDLAAWERCSARTAQLVQERDDCKAIAEKKYTARTRALNKLTGEELVQATAALEQEKAETEAAKSKLQKIKDALARAKKDETAARQKCRDAEKSHERWQTLQDKKAQLVAEKCDEDGLLDNAETVADFYTTIFPGNFYIELQNHGLDDEAYVMPILAKLARKKNLPVVAANDVHVAENSADCVRARRLISGLRFNKLMPETPDATEYYVKKDAELAEWLCRILDDGTVSQAMRNVGTIVDQCTVDFSKDTHFPRFKSDSDETAEQRLRRLTEEGIQRLYPNDDFPYRDRVEYELKIINQMQYTDYLCIVQDYLNYGRQLGKNNSDHVGYSIGPGRGSAAGSLVCYLIGITSVDPMPLNLIFERFLNPDRVSSPDIDADFSKEVREAVLQYVKDKYGEDAVCCIMTKSRLKAKAAVKAVARLYGAEPEDEEAEDAKEKAELKKKYFLNLGDAICKHIPTEPNVRLADCKDEIEKEFAANEQALAIFNDALLVENVAVTYGMHAAGVIIADNGDVGEYIPLQWNADAEQWCSQCDMVEAEMQAGLLKFDFLGLRNLDIISEALRLIKRNHGVEIDIEAVPQEAEVYREIFSKGNTNFVFQFESDGMKNALRQFKPENLEDIILMNAVFRPGPLQYLQDITAVKKGQKKPQYVCPAAKEVLEVTYGYPVYQEQIMTLCNKVAGFSLGESDLIRRFMSKKKADKMAVYQPKFIDGLVNNGATKEAAEQFWGELMNFASYAFNKSHAAAYAVLAYYTAWLKYHYPCEYMTAVMNNTAQTALPKMVTEAKRLGLSVLPPDMNASALNFTGKDGTIRFGLKNIKNVSAGAEAVVSEREQNGEYRSLKDFLMRVKTQKDVCEALADAGAFDLWCKNRLAVKTVLPDLLDDLSSIRKKAEIVNDESLTETKRSNAKTKLDAYQARFDATAIPSRIPEDNEDRAKREKELLGMYVSRHPIDEYPSAKTKRTLTIDDLTMAHIDNSANFCGIVSNIVTKTSKEGKRFAFFDLDDGTATIRVAMFPRSYSRYGNVLAENAAICVRGRIKANNADLEDEEAVITFEVDAQAAERLEKAKTAYLLYVPDLIAWTETVYPKVCEYRQDDGAELYLYDEALQEERKSTLRVSCGIVSADIPGVRVTKK